MRLSHSILLRVLIDIGFKVVQMIVNINVENFITALITNIVKYANYKGSYVTELLECTVKISYHKQQ